MEQNLTHQVSEMSPSSKREMQSKHNVSLERKSGIRHRQIKKRKQKSRIYMKSIESSSLKRVSGEISTKGSCDDSARRKQIRKTNHKTSGMKNSKKQLSSNLTGEISVLAVLSIFGSETENFQAWLAFTLPMKVVLHDIKLSHAYSFPERSMRL